jgi:hypothetical protein
MERLASGYREVHDVHVQDCLIILELNIDRYLGGASRYTRDAGPGA